MALKKGESSDFLNLKQLVKGLNLGEFLALQGHQLRRNKMCCPFCGSGQGPHKTPAFHIFRDNRYMCFSCLAHGDIIDFVMQAIGLDFQAAIEHIAKDMGLLLPEPQQGDKPLKRIKFQVGSRLIYDPEQNLIYEMPKYRYFQNREEVNIFTKKRELELADKLCRALASIAMVLAEGDEELDLIVGTMGDEFERRFYSLMNDKRWAFQKIIEWRNKLLNQRRQNEKK